MRTPPFPAGLRAEAKKLWREVFASWELDHDAVAILTVAVKSYSRFLDACDVLDKEGMCVQTEGGFLRKHPASEIAKNERSGFISAMASLGLKGEADEKRRVGRPGVYG